MKILISLLSLFLFFQQSFAQLRVDTYPLGKTFLNSTSQEFNNQSNISTQHNYKKEYKHAFSGGLSIGIMNFQSDLSENQSDLRNQLNLNLEINKRLSPWFSCKLIMSSGRYEAIGINEYQSLYTSGIDTEFSTSDFYHGILDASYASMSALVRSRIAFSKLNSIKSEKRFGLFMSLGLGYISAHVVLKNRTEHSTKISRSIRDIVIPIILEANYLLSDRLGVIASYDYYILANEYMDLLINNDTSDYLTNFRAGLFFKINN